MHVSDYEHAAVAFMLGALSDLALREFTLGVSELSSTKRNNILPVPIDLYFKNLSRKKTAIYGGIGGLVIFILHLMLPNTSVQETLVLTTVVSALQYLTVMLPSIERKYPELAVPISLVHFTLMVAVSIITINGIIAVSSNLQRT
jgi:hypothetical protein